MKTKMRRLALLLWIVSGALSGCLEGDPNPYQSGATDSDGEPQVDDDGSSGEPLRRGNPPGTEIAPSSACSESSPSRVSLNLKSDPRLPNLNLMWVEFGCGERAYGVLGSGAELSLSSFSGHVWRLRDASSNALLFEYTATEEPAQTITLF